MSTPKIKDLKPQQTQDASGQVNAGPVPPVLAQVVYGEMINGIPSIQNEPFSTFDEAVQFAGPLAQAGSHPILYIEYAGLKFGVNL